jgi:RNA polymerase sigma-70 factor, ECF subfamily
LNIQADVGLIAAGQQGDPRALRELFDMYKDRVYSLCRHMSGNAEDAEDLTQEIFVSAFEHLSGFRAESAFGTWLYRIATNQCLNRLRIRTRETASFLNLPEREALLPDQGPSPEDRVVRKELQQRMALAIAALPESLRAVFVLGTLEGMRYKEISEICECSEEAVKMRIHRARKQVRDKIKNYLDA